jgi:hypothetical protein
MTDMSEDEFSDAFDQIADEAEASPEEQESAMWEEDGAYGDHPPSKP